MDRVCREETGQLHTEGLLNICYMAQLVTDQGKHVRKLPEAKERTTQED